MNKENKNKVITITINFIEKYTNSDPTVTIGEIALRRLLFATDLWRCCYLSGRSIIN